MLLAWLRCTTTLLLLSVLVSAQNIFPSNSSGDLYPANSSPRFILNGSEFHGVPTVPLAPLGPYAQIAYSDFVDISATGQLVNVGASNANDPVSKYQFSYVSCDPSAYTGNIDASSVFDIVVNQPRASVVILYSETADHCTATNLGAIPFAIQSVLTTTDPHSAALLAKLNLNINSPGVCVISPDLSSYTNNTSLPGGGAAPGGTSTTAVAMIVLYSITGLITALFVVIVVTGAVRAHRHPERYGPRATSGGGRQSRAKGIARAMLDTLPIVKFSGNREATNSEHHKPESDIEMRAPVAADTASPTTNDANATTATTPPVPSPLPPAQAEQGHPAPILSTPTAIPSEREHKADSTTTPAPALAPSATTTPAPQASTTAVDNNHNPGCAICTEDFTQGEEMRVLPCNHKFHPECVDPWLLNVSGTCPLCRIDLNPTGETGSGGNGNGDGDLPPPIPRVVAMGDPSISSYPSDDGARRRDTITFAHLRSLASRHGSSSNAGTPGGGVEERIAILRRLRHERRNQRQDEDEDGDRDREGQGRETETERRGLARRFRERFRIRTERSGGPGSASASAPSPSSRPGPGPGPGSIAATMTI